MKRKALNSEEASGSIVNRVVSKISRAASAVMPPLYSLVDTVTRSRKKLNPQPKLPMKRLDLELVDRYTFTSDGKLIIII